MILTVVQGNRSTSFAAFEDGAQRAAFEFYTQPARSMDEYEALLSSMPRWQTVAQEIDVIVTASVVPALFEELRRALVRLLPDAALLTVGAGLRTGFTIRTDTPAELGADLVAGVSGALTCQKPPFLVLNCSAITTLSLVQSEKDGPAFAGCAILPGLALSAQALRDGAALLSSISLTHPAHAVGKNSTDSMRAGLVLGHADALNGLILRFTREVGEAALPLVVTGEEAELMLPLLCKEALCEPSLAHKGLWRIATLNEKKTRKRG